MDIEKKLNEIVDKVESFKSEVETKLKSNEDATNEVKELATDIKQRSVTKSVTEQKAEKEAEKEIAYDSMLKSLRTGENLDRNNGTESVITKGQISNSITKGLTVADPESAGVAIVEELLNKIIVPLKDEGRILGELPVLQTSSIDLKQIIQSKRAVAQWTDEDISNGGKSDTDGIKFKYVKSHGGKIFCQSFATNESLNDPAFQFETILINDFRRAFRLALQEVVVSGDGVEKPKGILGFWDAAESLKPDETRDVLVVGGVEVTTVPTEQALIDVARDLVLALDSGYTNSPKCKWFMNKATFDLFSRLKDDGATGTFYMQPDLTRANVYRLLGYEVVIDNNLPDMVDNSVGSLIFGDMSMFMAMVQHQGVNLIRNPYSVMGNTAFYLDQRYSTILQDASSIKLLSIKSV